jgi:hypothetical protein
MSDQINTIALSNPFDIERVFASALHRLNVGGAKVLVGDSTYPLDAVTHQNVFLPKIAFRAEELSILIFGVRLFPGVVYTIKKRSASGFQMEELSALSDSQREDPNFLTTVAHPAADDEKLTRALFALLLELSIAECFEIDVENNLLKSQALDMGVHKLFKVTAEYVDGQCLPLLPAAYLNANELQLMASQDVPLKAMNKARRLADELVQLRQARRESELSDSMDRSA